ncbi:MAG: hypothetical protein OXF54_19890 [Caldilineaceae bacterium]|nr:hypothetical protein [Caldilineaceae bacterium]
MSHPKRPRFIVVLLVALILTIAFASIAAARPNSAPNAIDDPPPPPGFGNTPAATPTSDAPPPPPGFNGGGSGGGGGSSTGGVAPPKTVNGLIKPVIYPWPPPNAIVLHPATPIQLSQAGSGLRVYFIARDGTSKIGPFFDNFTILASTYHGDPVTLYEGSNPGTGKPVTIDYLPAERLLRVSTFYADRPPHDFNKPYVFTVDADHNVKHLQW